MFTALLVLAAAAAVPVGAAPPPAPYADAPPAPPPIEMPRALTDQAMADKLGRTMGAMAHAVMNIPVGEMQAAIEGRPVTRADRNRRVGDVAGPDGRAMADHVAGNGAATGRAMQAAGRAMIGALPAILQAVRGAESEIERATSNLPDPTYPRR